MIEKGQECRSHLVSPTIQLKKKHEKNIHYKFQKQCKNAMKFQTTEKT